MIKKSLYPKTKRISNIRQNIILTEKLDGSNVGFFRLNNELLIATRSYVISLNEIEEVKNMLYKGMYKWLMDNGDFLKEQLLEKSGFFGEWLGMGKLGYKDLDKKVYMFAKANIDDNLDIKKVNYDTTLFIYPFINKEIPNFISIVPVVKSLEQYPIIEELDDIYDTYTKKINRNVEGFVINWENNIKKYVRMKNGHLTAHKA